MPHDCCTTALAVGPSCPSFEPRERPCVLRDLPPNRRLLPEIDPGQPNQSVKYSVDLELRLGLQTSRDHARRMPHPIIQENMVSGYTGHIPQLVYQYGKGYSEASAIAFRNFELERMGNGCYRDRHSKQGGSRHGGMSMHANHGPWNDHGGNCGPYRGNGGHSGGSAGCGQYGGFVTVKSSGCSSQGSQCVGQTRPAKVTCSGHYGAKPFYSSGPTFGSPSNHTGSPCRPEQPSLCYKPTRSEFSGSQRCCNNNCVPTAPAEYTADLHQVKKYRQPLADHICTTISGGRLGQCGHNIIQPRERLIRA